MARVKVKKQKFFLHDGPFAGQYVWLVEPRTLCINVRGRYGRYRQPQGRDGAVVSGNVLVWEGTDWRPPHVPAAAYIGRCNSS